MTSLWEIQEQDAARHRTAVGDSTDTKMSADEVLAVLDGNAAEWGKRLARYRGKADSTAARKGERDIHADRLCEWAELERAKALQARTAVAALIEREAALVTRNAELERKTAVQMGVGDGSGQLCVYGDYESIKAAQAFVIRCFEQGKRIAELEAERDALAAEVKALRGDAERWRHARSILTVDQIENAQSDYDAWVSAGETVSDEESKRADEAIDAARASAATGGGNG